MTFCFGWKNKEAVFLVADSAITVISDKFSTENGTSSFGEPVFKKNDVTVFESALKILRISDNCAIAYSGDIDSIFNIYEFMLENYSRGIELNDFIKQLNSSVLPLRDGNSVSFLIARVENNKPELLLWSSTNPEKIYSNQDYFHIGTNIYDFTGFAKTSVDAFRNKVKSLDCFKNEINMELFDNRRALNSVIAIYQALVIYYQTISSGVGGLINGLMIDSDGISWNYDTEYMVYNHERNDNDWITVGERDDAICLFSSVTKEKITISNSRVHGDIFSKPEFIKKHLEKFESLISSLITRSWIFIDKDINRITIINNKEFNGSDGYIRASEFVKENGKTDTRVEFNEQFSDYLFNEGDPNQFFSFGVIHEQGKEKLELKTTFLNR